MVQVSLKQLEAFCWIVRLGSFSAAAVHLNTSQPSITGRVRELESCLGVALFDRSGHRAQLTAKGTELFEYAGRMLRLETEITARISNQTAVSGIVRLGVVDTIALTWLPDLVSRVSQEHPGIVLELYIDLSVNLRSRLAARELDMAFLVRSTPAPGTTVLPLFKLRMELVASPAFVLPDRPVRPVDIADLPIISHTRGSDLSVATYEWFTCSGIDPKPFHGCTSLATMIKLASEGVGLAVAAPSVVARELRERVLRIVPTSPPFGPFEFVITARQYSARPALDVISQMATEISALFPIASFADDAPVAAAAAAVGTRQGKP